MLLDLSQDQAAEVLGVAPGTIGLHLHRAIAALRTSLTALGFTEAEG